MIIRRCFIYLLFSLLIGHSAFSYQENSTITDQNIAAFIDSLFHDGIKKKLIPGGVIGLFHNEHFVHQQAYGMADMKTRIPASHDSTLYQLGSVGKLLTAIAVLQLTEQGRLHLDDNVNNYLTTFRVNTPSPRPLTLRDLLSHSGGLNDRVIGYATKTEGDTEPLGEHLKKRMPRLYTEPGTEISYSNYGYGLAGYLVELRSGLDFKTYIQQNIFDRLDMATATYNTRNSPPGIHYAKGYELNDSFEPKATIYRHLTPAGSLIATGADMAKLTLALIEEDSNLLSTASYKLLKTQHISDGAQLMGYTLGMEVQNINGNSGFGKAGNIPGFLSYLLFFPDRDMAMYLAVNTETDNFLQKFTESFSKQFLPPESVISPPVLKGENLSLFTGEYRNNRYNRNTIEDLFGNILGNFRIYQQGDSLLTCYHSGAWQTYRPVSPLVFQHTLQSDLYLYFEKDTKGKVRKLYRNYELGGYFVPAGYEKLAWYDTINFINEYLGYFPIFILSFLLLPAGWAIIWLIRLRKKERFKTAAYSPQTKIAGVAFSLITGVHIFMVLVKLIQAGEDLLFGIPGQVALIQNFSFLIPALLLIVIYRLFKVWQNEEGFLANRIYFSLYSLSGIVYTLALWRWHFIGVHF